MFLQNTGSIYQTTLCYFIEEHYRNSAFIFLSFAWNGLIMLCYVCHLFTCYLHTFFLLCTLIQGLNVEDVIGLGELDFTFIPVKISVNSNVKLYEGCGHIRWMKSLNDGLHCRFLASLDSTCVVWQRYTVVLYKTNWFCSIFGCENHENHLALTGLDYMSVSTALWCSEY